VTAILFGVLWLALSLGITQALTQGGARPGDATTSGTVTAVASFIDAEDPASPASTGRIAEPGWLKIFT
jgi:hypothetical protein